MRLIAQSVLLAAGGAVLGLGMNRLSPHPVRLGQPVFAASASGTTVCGGGEPGGAAHAQRRAMSLADAVAACGGCGAGFVDARGAAAYAHGHIPGALHLPPAGHGDESAALAALRRFSSVVIYDADARGRAPGCRLADAVADRLAAAGFPQIRILDGSWTDWQAAGGPAESGACGACGAADHHDEPGGAR